MTDPDVNTPCVLHGQVRCPHYLCEPKSARAKQQARYRKGGGLGSASFGEVIGDLVDGAIDTISDIWS